MADMSKTIIAKSDQLNAADLIGGSITIKITKVNVGSPTSPQPVSIYYEGDNGRPYKPCLGMRRALIVLWGKESDNYVSKSLTLFRNPDVLWAGKKEGGIQISHASDISSKKIISVRVSSKSTTSITVDPIDVKKVKPADPELIKKGDEAAKGGIQSYIKWRDGLPEDKKEQIRPNNREWSRTARQVDEDKTETVDPETGEITSEETKECETITDENGFPIETSEDPEGEIK